MNALNKGINNPEDQKGHLEGESSITLYKLEYYTKSVLKFITDNKGKQVKLSGYTVCDTSLYPGYIKTKYEQPEAQPDKECVILEIIMEKQ